MRIAIFAETFLPKWDGIAHTLCHLLDYLALNGHSSLMFAPQGAPENYAKTPIIGLPSFSFPLYPDLHLVPPFFNVRRQLELYKPDLIHIINPAFLGLIGLRHARELDLPIVASYHTDLPGYTDRYGISYMRDTVWAYFRWIHNQADLNLCPSEYTKNQLRDHQFERLKIWGRGVDTERFHPSFRDMGWRSHLTDGHPEAPLLLFVSRLANEKRIDWLLNLFNELPDIRLAIVGDGPARGELETLFKNTPTVFAGYLHGEALSRAYASADMFVFPSNSETFGNVVIEAMASGLPAICARAGGPVDHIRDGVNGFLFDADDVDDMVAKVKLVLSDPKVMKEMGQHARAYAETQTWESIFDSLLNDYESAISMHQPTLWHQTNQWLKAKVWSNFSPNTRV